MQSSRGRGSGALGAGQPKPALASPRRLGLDAVRPGSSNCPLLPGKCRHTMPWKEATGWERGDLCYGFRSTLNLLGDPSKILPLYDFNLHLCITSFKNIYIEVKNA